jgi:hypothetical protein
VFQLERTEQKRLKDYLLHRTEQLKEHAQVLEFFKAEEKLAPYLRGLSLIVEEIDGKNDSRTKLDNTFHLLSNQGCSIFFKDLIAIVSGEEQPLPDDILLIPAYLAKMKLQEEEAERKRQDEQSRREREQLQEMWKQRDREAKERKQAELCSQLGISRKALAKLQEEE